MSIEDSLSTKRMTSKKQPTEVIPFACRSTCLKISNKRTRNGQNAKAIIDMQSRFGNANYWRVMNGLE